jgi:hypothetical protein
MKVVQIDPPVAKKDVQLTFTADEAKLFVDYFSHGGYGKRTSNVACQEWSRTASAASSKVVSGVAAELEKLGY